MRARTLISLFFAIVLAGGTAFLARAWLASERSKELAEAAPMALATPAKSVLVARTEIRRGQILRPDEMVWQTWPEGGLDKNYVVMGGPRTPESFAGWVAKNPIAGGEPISEAKIIAPGNRGFLAAVLRPGMRAISVPVTITSGISGFIFPGDQVDLMLTYSVPVMAAAGDNKDKKALYEHKVAETVLRDIRVIAIDQRLESKPGEAVVAHTATFEVSAKQTEVILLASEIGKVNLILRPLVPDPAEPPAAEPSRAEAPDTDRRMVATLVSATTPASRPRLAEPSDRTSGSSSATADASQAVTVISGPPAGSAPAKSPSGGPRVATPSVPTAGSSPGATATYTLDSEISKMLPQPKGEKDDPEPPKLWVC
ncbi:MAG TPA: Flp pilus assembly protein CpaB, partial [Stellaceae bacterium]